MAGTHAKERSGRCRQGRGPHAGNHGAQQHSLECSFRSHRFPRCCIATLTNHKKKGGAEACTSLLKIVSSQLPRYPSRLGLKITTTELAYISGQDNSCSLGKPIFAQARQHRAHLDASQCKKRMGSNLQVWSRAHGWVVVICGRCSRSSLCCRASSTSPIGRLCVQVGDHCTRRKWGLRCFCPRVFASFPTKYSTAL